jgi:ABC-type antimicrobial peptide transport system permease subunit
VGVGLLASLGLTRFASSLLYGVAPNDPITLSATAGVLVVVALLAAWLPTRRALRVDPAVSLRSE